MAQTTLPQSRLFFDLDMTEGESLEVAAGSAVVFSSRCPDKPSPNEDAAAVFPTGDASAVLIVADGVGGVASGEQASLRAVEAVCDALRAADSSGGTLLRPAILDGMEQANRAVLDMGVGAATTLAVVEIHQDTIRPYHVGDSTILVVGQRGKVKLQTVSHSPVGFAVESGMLDAAEAMHHEDRHLVSNVIGSTEMRIEVGSAVTLRPRDTVLLASDGLMDNLHAHEIIAHVCKGPLGKSTAAMAGAARRRMEQPRAGHPSKPDDLTFIAYRRHTHWSRQGRGESVKKARRG
jgi:serine/threonine protein phosphatase PrpC